MSTLNAQQMRAVKADGHCVVLACPGSGKTRVLAMRAAHLLSQHQEGRLCAVTFTRDAAAELKGRILDQCGRFHARRIAVGTFHSIAYGQMKRASAQMRPRILSDSERLALLRRCREACGARISMEALTSMIDAVKATTAQQPDLPESVRAIYEMYQDHLARDGAMDFFDIMLQALRLMREGALRPLPIRWLLVDEAQDMDDVQMHWVLEHAKQGVEITLVGDDDQSLYGFRHALGYAGLRHVQEALSARTVQLPVNYRCASAILAHAARLIAHNAERAPKDIRPHRQDEGVIEVSSHASRWSEARAIALAIVRHEGSWAILARTNALLDHVEAALAIERIEYSRMGGGSLWDGRVGAVYLGLLRSVADGGWIGIAGALHACGVDAHALMTDRDHGDDPNAKLAALAGKVADDERPMVHSLIETMPQWWEQSRRGRAGLVIHATANWLSRYLPQSQQEILGLIEACLANMSGTLPQRLAFVAKKVKPSSQRVTLMTLHASKGLEFDNVWIMGCEEGVLPHAEGQIEEERRLMYVGMTRARHRLHISHTDAGQPSRFMRESEITVRNTLNNTFIGG